MFVVQMQYEYTKQVTMWQYYWDTLPAGAQCRNRKKRKNKRRGTYYILLNKASSNGLVVAHTYQQLWKAGDLEQVHVLQTGGREREGDRERYQ